MNKMFKNIYFDNAATTPVAKEVVRAMHPYWNKKFGNASSSHIFGQQAGAATTKSRKIIADFFYCNPEEIVFTSGATESSNMAIKGVMNFYDKQWQVKKIDKKPHFITTAIEHPSVLESGLALERDGYGLSIVNPSSDGLVEIDNVLSQINNQTVLISLMYVNNETGVMQSVQKLGKQLIDINKTRIENDLSKIYFHVDAVQGLRQNNCRPDHIKADLISFSSHKIYGPKGMGFLYIRSKTPLLQLLNGGHQERATRGGTLNSTGIVGLGAAIQYLQENEKKLNNKIGLISDYLYEELRKIKGISFNSSQDESVHSIINFAIKGVLASELQIMLDLHGIATSTGSACASGSVQASPVLVAMGQSSEQALAGLRVSLGKDNTMKQAKYFIKTLHKILNKLTNV
jgi:cysteine desulfurase